MKNLGRVAVMEAMTKIVADGSVAGFHPRNQRKLNLFPNLRRTNRQSQFREKRGKWEKSFNKTEVKSFISSECSKFKLDNWKVFLQNSTVHPESV